MAERPGVILQAAWPAQSQPTPQPQPGPGSVSGQGVVGVSIATPWWPGVFDITQGWGPTDYAGEPPEDRNGQHYAHWHAGVDVGAPTGTHVQLPVGISTARVKAVDNPDGYGTALVVQLTAFDVWLGHLATRFVKDGDQVRGGQDLALSDNTGNSSGPHIHFEVRPSSGKYGTDVDPTVILTSGEDLAAAPGLPDPFGAVAKSIADAEAQAQRTILGAGQVALGTVMVLGGLYVTARTLAPARTASALARLRPRPPGPSQPLRRTVPRGTPGPQTPPAPDRMRLRQS